ncbi:N-acetyltransferase GCN5 [Paraphoma chrysanthemicola]|uniref:N-acetyltransferase GCN5 n=1 Tax=Paraphoma chrysanthemicola TaxID=798071 RepID=A0A8K0VVU5_9PLEO|nr:N-acetyltransferase GCN5 [Paraphoma chrysanthemicola]
MIQEENITAPDVISLLDEHVEDMRCSTPGANSRLLDLTALQHPSVTFHTSRNDYGELLGCYTLKELSPGHGEIKSMRVSATHQRRGIAREMTRFLIFEARSRRIRMKKLSLETGPGEKWVPAQKLFEGCGFEVGAPYRGYRPDDGSIFMGLDL